jgi:hypothetical protein
MVRYDDYLQTLEHWNIVRQIPPFRLKFGGEKTIKGTYTVTAFCSISQDVYPISYHVHDERNDSQAFSDAVCHAMGRHATAK